MTIPLTGPQSLFVRLGHIFNLFNAVNYNRGTVMPPKVDTLWSDFQTTDQVVIGSIYQSLLSYQNAMNTLPSSLQAVATNVVTQMVNDDQPQTSLTSLNIAMGAVVDQMVNASATVQQCNVSGTVTPNPGNHGNAILLIILDQANGTRAEDVFSELVTATVVSDSQSGNATAGSEPISLAGRYAAPSSLSWLYPQGSGSSATINCVNPSINGGSGTRNALTNGQFENWTGNVPNNWGILVGTAGTTVKKSTATFYDGAAAVQFVGNGSELTAIAQQFGISTGTPTRLGPIAQSISNCWIYVDVVPAAGVLEISLIDPTGAVLTDVRGTPSLFTRSLTTLPAATWVPVHGPLRTPRILPASVRIRVRLSTALSAGSNLFIDRASLAQASGFYPGGPGFIAFSGNVPLILNDGYQATVFNDYGGKFQILFDRFFGMRQMGLQLPSSNSPTIPDSLIS